MAARGSLQMVVDVSLIVDAALRLAAASEPAIVTRHLDAMIRDQSLLELRLVPPGSCFTHRAVPSVELLRLLEQHAGV